MLVEHFNKTRPIVQYYKASYIGASGQEHEFAIPEWYAKPIKKAGQDMFQSPHKNAQQLLKLLNL